VEKDSLDFTAPSFETSNGIVVDSNGIMQPGYVITQHHGDDVRVLSRELAENETIIYGDIETALNLRQEWPQVRWDGKKWIGEGEPIPQPKTQEPFDALEDLSFRVARIEATAGIELSENVLSRLTSEHQEEIRTVINR